MGLTQYKHAYKSLVFDMEVEVDYLEEGNALRI